MPSDSRDKCGDYGSGAVGRMSQAVKSNVYRQFPRQQGHGDGEGDREWV